MLINTPCPDLAFDRRRDVDSSRVLVVGADQRVLEEVSGIIQKIGGFEMQRAKSTEDGLRVATEFRPGFVLLHSDAPDLDCYRFASLLHQRVGLHDTPYHRTHQRDCCSGSPGRSRGWVRAVLDAAVAAVGARRSSYVHLAPGPTKAARARELSLRAPRHETDPLLPAPAT